MRAFADVNPVSLVVNAARGLTIGHGGALGPALGTLAWLVGLLLVFVPLSVGAFRRAEPGRDQTSPSGGAQPVAVDGHGLARRLQRRRRRQRKRRRCKLPGSGKTIDSGSTGTDSDGKVYSCTNGTGCQVEGGKVTDKCSHMSKLIGYTRPTQASTWTFQLIR